MQQQGTEFGIDDARRVLGEVFAPWVQDLHLSVEEFDFAPPPNAAADWQPGAVLRLPFSERLCRSGGIVCGQALMAFADTAMVIANLAANRGGGLFLAAIPSAFGAKDVMIARNTISHAVVAIIGEI